MTDQIPVELEKSVTLSQESIELLAKEISILNKKMILEIFDDSRLITWIKRISQAQFFMLSEVENMEKQIKALQNELTPKNENEKPS
jgi:hypothetical protein